MENVIDLRNTKPEVTPPSTDPSQKNGGFWARMSIVQKLFSLIILLIFLFFFYVTLDANKYAATVHVIEGEGRVGVNPTTERLDFGDLSPGTQSERKITITNRSRMPLYIYVFRIGDITDLMTVSKTRFILTPSAEEQLSFAVRMPASAPIGSTLDGRVIIFRIPRPWRS